MSWRQIHRWLGLSAGTLALVLGLTGTLLAFDPLQQAWIARPPAPELDAATLVGRVARTVPGAQEIRRDLERSSRADTGASDAGQALGVAGRQAVPVGQVLVVLGLAAGHPQRAGVGALRIGQVDGEVGAVAAVVLELECERHRAALRRGGQGERAGSSDAAEQAFEHGKSPLEFGRQ